MLDGSNLPLQASGPNVFASNEHSGLRRQPLFRYAQLLCCELGDIMGVVSPRLIDLDHLGCDDPANRVITINQVQRFEGERREPCQEQARSQNVD